MPVARRTVLQDRRRSGLATSGLAVSLVLVLVLEGVFAGALRQVTAYLRSLPVDVVVSQQGVRTMHMSSSSLSPEQAAAIASVDGVAEATAIQFTTSTVTAAQRRQLSYLIGYDTAQPAGGPQRLVDGQTPVDGEAVLDKVAAGQLGVGIGDSITALGRSFRISGLSTGGTSITNTTTFITSEDFRSLRGSAVSYVLVRSSAGLSARELATRIEGAVPGTTAQTKAAIISSEGDIVRDMSADLMQLMTVIGLLIALAVVALTLFTATLSKLREYAVLKALGATNRRLVATVLDQVLWYVGLAVVAAIGVTLIISWALAALSPTVRITVEWPPVLRLALSTFVVAAIGAVTPLRRVLQLEPASAFRRPT